MTVLTVTATDTTITAAITEDDVEVDACIWTENETAEMNSDAEALAAVTGWVTSEGWTITGPLEFDTPVQIIRRRP